MSSNYVEEVHNIQIQQQEEIHVQAQTVKQTKLKKQKKHKHDIVQTQQQQQQTEEDHELFTLPSEITMPTLPYQTLQTQTYAQETSEIVSHLHVGQINVESEREHVAQSELAKELNALTQQQQHIFEVAEQFESTLKSLTEGYGKLDIVPGLQAQSTLQTMPLQSTEQVSDLEKKSVVQATQEYREHYDSLIEQTQIPYDSLKSQDITCDVKEAQATLQHSAMHTTIDTYVPQTVESTTNYEELFMPTGEAKPALSTAHAVSKQENFVVYESMSQMEIAPEEQKNYSTFAPAAETQNSVVEEQTSFYSDITSALPQVGMSAITEQNALQVSTHVLQERETEFTGSTAKAQHVLQKHTETNMKLATKTTFSIEDTVASVPEFSLKSDTVSTNVDVSQSTNVTNIQTVYESTSQWRAEKPSILAEAVNEYMLHKSVAVAAEQTMDTSAVFAKAADLAEHVNTLYESEQQNQTLSLELVTSSYELQPQTEQAGVGLLTHKGKDIRETTALETSEKIQALSEPEMQTGQSNYNVISALNVYDVKSMESELNIPESEPTKSNTAQQTNTDSLPVAQIEKEFIINSVSALESTTPKTSEQASYTHAEHLPLTASDLLAFETIAPSAVTEEQSVSITDIETVEHKNILEIRTTLATERIEGEMPVFEMSQSIANETVNEVKLRSALVDIRQTQETVDSATISQEVSKHANKVSNELEQLCSETYQIYEKEADFTVQQLDTTKQAMRTFNIENTSLAVSNEDVFEKEESLALIENKVENANENETELHRLPLVEEVQNMDTTETMKNFTYTEEKHGISVNNQQGKMIYENMPLEMPQYDQVLFDITQLKENILDSSLMLNENTALQYENVTTERESMLPKDTWDEQYTKTSSSEANQFISIVEQAGTLDAAISMPTFVYSEKSRATETLSQSDVKSQVVTDTQPYDTISLVHQDSVGLHYANIEHEVIQIGLREEQQVADSETSYQSAHIPKIEPFTTITPANQKAPTIDEVNPQSGLGVLELPETTAFEIKPDFVDANMSISVTENFGLTQAGTLVVQPNDSQTAATIMGEDFQRTPVKLMHNVYNKEMPKEKKHSSEEEVKISPLFIMLHERKTSETFVVEPMENYEQKRSLETTALTSMADNVRQAQMQSQNICMQNEASFEDFKEEKLAHKNFEKLLHGTLVETVLPCDQIISTEETPAEKMNLSKIYSPQNMNNLPITQEQNTYEVAQKIIDDKNNIFSTFAKSTSTFYKEAVLSQKNVACENVENIPENIQMQLMNTEQVEVYPLLLNEKQTEPEVKVLQKNDDLITLEIISAFEKKHVEDSHLSIEHIKVPLIGRYFLKPPLLNYKNKYGFST